MMDFVLIQPGSLRAAWKDVLAGLDKMPPEDWIAEDVYHAIKSGSAALYFGYNESGYAGFFVLQLLTAEYSGTKSVHCWLAHNVGDADVFTAAEDFIRQVARNAGAERITFASPRKGWAKRYKLVTATYEVSL